MHFALYKRDIFLIGGVHIEAALAASYATHQNDPLIGSREKFLVARNLNACARCLFDCVDRRTSLPNDTASEGSIAHKYK